MNVRPNGELVWLTLNDTRADMSRPHASDRQRGRDYELYPTGLTAHEHVQA